MYVTEMYDIAKSGINHYCPRIRILLPKKVYRRERMKIGRNKNEKKRNTIEYKQIPVAD
jgi:hypothetical protein